MTWSSLSSLQAPRRWIVSNAGSGRPIAQALVWCPIANSRCLTFLITARRSFGENLVALFRTEPPPSRAQRLHRTREKKRLQDNFSLNITSRVDRIPEHNSCKDLDWSAMNPQCQLLKENPCHCTQTFGSSSAPKHRIQFEVLSVQAISLSVGRLGCRPPTSPPGAPNLSFTLRPQS